MKIKPKKTAQRKNAFHDKQKSANFLKELNSSRLNDHKPAKGQAGTL